MDRGLDTQAITQTDKRDRHTRRKIDRLTDRQSDRQAGDSHTVSQSDTQPRKTVGKNRQTDR